MEASLFSLIGALLISGGWIWKGLARWLLSAIGSGIITVALPSLWCQFHPEACPTDLFERLPNILQPVIISSTDQTVLGRPLEAETGLNQLPDAIDLLSLIPPPTPTPPPVPTPPPAPIPSLPSPSPVPTPDPYLSPCKDGNCTCVDYKCLW